MELAARAAAALGIELGPTYTQIIVGSRGPRLGELAARLGGGHDAELLAAALGVELNELVLAAALGEPIEAEPTRAGARRGRRLHPLPGRAAGRAGGGARSRGRLGAGGRGAGQDLPRAGLRRADRCARAPTASARCWRSDPTASRRSIERGGRPISYASRSQAPESPGRNLSRSALKMRRSYRLAATALITGACVAYIFWKIDVGADAARARRHAARLLRRGGRDHGRERLADGLALAAAAGRARDPRSAGLARTRLLHLLHGRPGASDLARRRRDAHLRDQPAASRATAVRRRARSCSSALLGGSGDAASGRARLRARDRSLQDRRLSLDRGHADRRRRRAGGAPLRSLGSAPARQDRAAAAQAAAGAARCARSIWASTPTATNAALLVGVFALTVGVQAVRILAIWCSGKAVGIDLGPRPYYVMGPLLLLVQLVPFTVNGLAVARDLLHQLPRAARRGARSRLRGRLSLLPGHGAALASGRAHSRLGGGSRNARPARTEGRVSGDARERRVAMSGRLRAGAGRSRSQRTVARSRSSSSPTTPSPGSSPAWRAFAAAS